MKTFDLAVIGAGPGGYVAAIRAAQQGACVCLIEEDRVGGTCLNRGCIPTKALYSTARTLRQVNAAEVHGIHCSEVSFDFPTAMQRKDKVVSQLVGGIEQLLKGNRVDLFRGQAFIKDRESISIRRQGVVGHIKASKIIIATGSLPLTPKALPVDEKNILTSTGILAIKELPRHLLVIGGGYIGCEFAGIFASCGSQVTVVEALPQILTFSDRQVVRDVEKGFRELGVEVLTDTSVEQLKATGSSVHATLAGGRDLEVDKALVAIGRRPNSDNLGLEELGVDLDDRGAIKVDDRLRTNIENIYAIGDVTGGIQLAHVASYQAEVAVANILGGDETVDYRVVPSSIFTHPEIGQVGMTEAQCKEKGIEVDIGRFAYQASSKALCDGETVGSVKLIAARDDGRILGAHIAGEEASTLIAEVASAMAAGMSAKRLADVIHAHPTLPEIIKEAAEDVTGLAVHKIGRRR